MKPTDIPKEIARMRPIWIKYIVDLGYTMDQGKAFADGYATELAKLSPKGKLLALDGLSERCMTAGLKAANIDEKDVSKRMRRKTPQNP